MKLTALGLIFLAFMPLNSSWAKPVIRDGIEWLQPADFVNVSAEEIYQVCDIYDSRICNGEVAGTNLTGYKWAFLDEVVQLFNSYGISPPMPPPRVSSSTYSVSLFEQSSRWAPAILDDFNPTEITAGGTELKAMTLEFSANIIPIIILPNNQFVTKLVDHSSRAQADSISLITLSSDRSSPSIGAWFWREVPEARPIPSSSPLSLILILLGMMIFAAAQLRRY